MTGYTISISPAHLSNFEAICLLTWRQGVAREPRPDGLRPSHGIAAAQGVRPGGAALSRSAAPPVAVLQGSTLVHDFRPARGAFQPARHRQLPAGAGAAALSLR